MEADPEENQRWGQGLRLASSALKAEDVLDDPRRFSGTLL